jgi:tRNA G37 N-methylase TrmD
VVRFIGLADDTAEELLGKSHHVPVIRIGAVELAGGELGVMGLVDALVPEVLPDLEHPREAADEEAFEKEFGGDAHEEGHLVVVVVGHEGFLG